MMVNEDEDSSALIGRHNDYSVMITISIDSGEVYVLLSVSDW